jgi:hypothetical protein
MLECEAFDANAKQLAASKAPKLGDVRKWTIRVRAAGVITHCQGSSELMERGASTMLTMSLQNHYLAHLEHLSLTTSP